MVMAQCLGAFKENAAMKDSGSGCHPVLCMGHGAHEASLKAAFERGAGRTRSIHGDYCPLLSQTVKQEALKQEIEIMYESFGVL